MCYTVGKTALRLCMGLLAVLLLPTLAVAQASATPTSRLTFDQSGPDLGTVQAFRFVPVLDGTRLAPATATCAGTTSPFVCSIPFPAAAPGDHVVLLHAQQLADGQMLESLPSQALAFRMYVAPLPPANLRITERRLFDTSGKDVT